MEELEIPLEKRTNQIFASKSLEVGRVTWGGSRGPKPKRKTDDRERD